MNRSLVSKQSLHLHPLPFRLARHNSGVPSSLEVSREDNSEGLLHGHEQPKPDTTSIRNQTKNNNKKQGEMQAADYSPVQQRHLRSGDLLFINFLACNYRNATLLDMKWWST